MRSQIKRKDVKSSTTSQSSPNEVIYLPTCDIEAYKLLMRSRKTIKESQEAKQG
jgi:hypothetical protein